MGNKGSRTDLLRVTKDQRTNKGNKGTDALRVGATDASCSNDPHFPTEAERAIRPTPKAIRRRELPIHSPETAFQNRSRQHRVNDPTNRANPRIFFDYERDENLDDLPFDDLVLNALTKGIVKISNEDKRKEGIGMAFLVKEGNKLYLYTSKHNFVYGKEEEEGTTIRAKVKRKWNKLKGEPNRSPKELQSFDETHWSFPRDKYKRNKIPFEELSRGNPPTPGDCIEIEIPRLDQEYLKRNVFWRYGFDAVRFEVIPSPVNLAMTGLQAYEFPEEAKIKYEKDMQIGIVVWDIKYGENENERPAFFGDIKYINIYRGTILRSNTHTIDCSYNSYSGCSGAPVICMDERYQNYYGKVIAIHAGSPSEYEQDGIPGNNIAFKLTKRNREKMVFTAKNGTKR